MLARVAPGGLALALLLVPGGSGCAAGGEDDGAPRPDGGADATLDTRYDDGGDASDSTVPDALGGDTVPLFDVDDPSDGVADAAADVVAEAEAPPVDTGPLGGCGIPAGTTVTASGSYSSTPEMTIDGDLGTYWNSGDYTGWVRLTFPAPQAVESILLQVTALPATTETYTITGSKGGAEAVIGTATPSVAAGPSKLAPIAVTAGAYDAIQIGVGASASWIAIAEIALQKTGCPPQK